MKKDNKKKTCKNSAACPLSEFPQDSRTRYADLGWRAGYTIVAWGVLSLGISKGNGFFISLMLFAIPLIMDYAKFTPNTIFRIKLKRFGMVSSGIWIIVAFFGLTGALSVDTLPVESLNDTVQVFITTKSLIFRNESFPLMYLWTSVLISVVLTIVDWYTYRTRDEELIIDILKNNQRA